MYVLHTYRAYMGVLTPDPLKGKASEVLTYTQLPTYN